MNYYKTIVKLNLKKYKKSYISLFIVIILACTFTLSITIFNDSLIKTEEQQRKDIYGSWHISVYNTDDTLFKDILNHGTMKSIGKMTAYGNVLNDNNAIGIIGSADDNTVQMGLSLMDGRFPEKDNEIAVEMSYLSMLGYSYELGQAIPLRIQSYNDKNKKIEEIEKTYILSGVLKNYSSIWKTDGNQLVSFFVTNTSLPVSPMFENVFGTIKKEFVKNADELSVLAMDRGNFIKNDYTYYEYTSKNKAWNEAFLSGFLLVLIVTITSAFFIFNIFYTSLKEHDKNFVVMRCLGASKNQISILYCKELLFVLSMSFAAGIIFGLFVSSIGCVIIRYYVTGEFVFYLNIIKLILLMFIIIIFVLLFAVFSVLRIRKMPLTGDVKLQPENKIYFSRNRKLKPLTIRHMVRIFNSAHRKEAVVYFLLSLGSFLVLVSTFYRSYQKYTDYSSIINTYTQDYDYGVISSYFEPKTHMAEDEVEQIKKIYGIDYIRAYRCSNYLPITWKGMEESEYAEYLKNNFYLQYAGDASVHTMVYGISDDVRDYKFYLDEIDKGNVSAEEFLKGNEVILYLPAYYKTQDGKLLSNINIMYPLLKSPYDVIKEYTIGVGDEMVISGERDDVTVKVAGIIYDFDNKSSQSFLGKPYSIICNDTLYGRLISVNNKKTYEYLQIYANKNANYERTEVEISKIKDNFYLQNYRIQKENAKYDALVNVIISLISCFIAIFITVTVQCNNQVAEMESDYWRNHIFRVLGMDKWKIQLIYFYNVIKNSMLAVITGFMAIYSYQTVIFIENINFPSENKKILNIERYVFEHYFITLPWGYVGLFTLAYLIMNVLITFYPLKKYRKIKE